jgi:serine protein kinase
MSRDLFDSYTKAFESRRETLLTVQEYLEGCQKDPLMFAGPHEAPAGRHRRAGDDRHLARPKAGTHPLQPDDPGLSEVLGILRHGRRTIERIVAFFRHAARGSRSASRSSTCSGRSAAGKSSLAERIKALMEEQPIYVLKAGDDLSPVFESPLALFDPETQAQLRGRYGIPARGCSGLMSPWALKRLDEFGGDITKFRVAKVKPSRLRQIAIAKTEPGDENNQDISSLVGKVDIRKLEITRRTDPDAYSYSGGLNRANQGVLEFVEMFKAPIKMLHPLLTATQEGNYVGSENIGAIPFTGIVHGALQRERMADASRTTRPTRPSSTGST